MQAGKAARSLGKMLDNMGKNMEVAKYTEKLVPSTRYVAVDGVAPVVSESGVTFVAPSASVIGDVTLGANSSIWYGATVRGDVNKVTIGENTAIGDRAVVHVAKIQGDFATTIGSNVVVGPCAVIHACTLKDSVSVGAGAQVMDGATVESHTMIAPGSVVTPGTTVPTGELWSGSPAKKIRALTQEEMDAMTDAVESQSELAKLHAEENAKDFYQISEDADVVDDILHREDDYVPRDYDPSVEGDVEGMGVPGRIFNSTLTHPEEGLKLRQAQQEQRERDAAEAQAAKEALRRSS